MLLEELLFWLYQTLNQAFRSALRDHLLSLCLGDHLLSLWTALMLMEHLLYLSHLGNLISCVLNIYMISNIGYGPLIRCVLNISIQVMDHLIMDDFMPKF